MNISLFDFTSLSKSIKELDGIIDEIQNPKGFYVFLTRDINRLLSREYLEVSRLARRKMQDNYRNNQSNNRNRYMGSIRKEITSGLRKARVDYSISKLRELTNKASSRYMKYLDAPAAINRSSMPRKRSFSFDRNQEFNLTRESNYRIPLGVREVNRIPLREDNLRPQRLSNNLSDIDDKINDIEGVYRKFNKEVIELINEKYKTWLLGLFKARGL